MGSRTLDTEQRPDEKERPEVLREVKGGRTARTAAREEGTELETKEMSTKVLAKVSAKAAQQMMQETLVYVSPLRLAAVDNRAFCAASVDHRTPTSPGTMGTNGVSTRASVEETTWSRTRVSPHEPAPTPLTIGSEPAVRTRCPRPVWA